MTDVPIRDAASVVLLRDADSAPKVLMGQRGKNAAFMPNKYVFPGGAVDPEDAQAVLPGTPSVKCLSRLGDIGPALLAAALRETWEETGLTLRKCEGLLYFFRAITPPGRPRRFDARFFLADANTMSDTDLDDFSKASDELRHLHWVPLPEARALNLPFITEVVLAEVEALSKTKAPPDSVPFFDNSSGTSRFLRIQ
ncbi:8-oxo-dGTP pyrophosphatase MutT (NUDIX family) [Litoreibacter meonggei]|uniref:8-oxo-dGTP pyrophosphatase MutT (NUDIX family) n=1 Tax=Litoreibacter meonggei TaxID=1049199 RepID=A0A497X5R8_9RHOB|nr:NUDIX hydrolase [Litoreibacter meonggei]RLJ60552.1 8-oxo-dGTP pyrophosphatase MutT (NUDIX family) [Litoreibacter meonggei]